MSATYADGCLVNEERTVAICGGGGFWYRRLLHCPTCERRRRFVIHWELWYGDAATCLGCGDRWMDGERGERPFARGWREKAKAKARERYAAAMTYRQFRVAEHAYVNDYFTAPD